MTYEWAEKPSGLKADLSIFEADSCLLKPNSFEVMKRQEILQWRQMIVGGKFDIGAYEMIHKDLWDFIV